MLHGPSALAIFLAHRWQRFAVIGLDEPARDAPFSARRLLADTARRAMAAAGDIVALARGEARPAAGLPAVPPALEAELVEAHLLIDHHRGRAAAAERRVADLESRLAAAEMQALELRSRVVCLQGKLATTSATVRYQSMTLALETPPQAEARGA